MSVRNVENPTGGALSWDCNVEPALNDNLMERVFSPDNMRNAWKHVKANKGAPGVDKMSISDFPKFAKDNWENIRTKLIEDKYQPCPVRRVVIPKSDGGSRNLGVPVVLDRVIEQAINQALSPSFDATFSNASFGFRPFRSAHDAVKQVRKYFNLGYKYVVDIDLSNFFDTVNHDLLIQLISVHPFLKIFINPGLSFPSVFIGNPLF